MTVLLNNYPSGELCARLASLGVAEGLARRLLAAAVRRGELPPVGPGLSRPMRERLERETSVPRLSSILTVTSPRDGFIRHVFVGDDGDRFESVGIPLIHRAGDAKLVVCVSSQVGCAMGCTFCATGRLGFGRNLAPWEIVEQVAHVRRTSPLPVRGVVFMGMGEPLLNYDAAITAARILSEPCGLAIDAKAITLSTAGIVPGIRRLAAEGHPYRLIVSLNSADPVRRRALMPGEEQYPLEELMDALRAYHAATGRRVTLAWTLIAGVNTGADEARRLAILTRGLPVKIDLIDVNDATGRFRPPADAERNAFRDALREHVGAPVARRYSGGQDIQAACGMLVAAPAPAALAGVAARADAAAGP